MRASEIFALVGAEAKASSIAGTKKDVDVHSYINSLLAAKFLDQQEAAEQAEAHELATKGVVTRKSLHAKAPITRSDVSQPFVPGSTVSFHGEDTFVADGACPVVPGNVARRYMKFSRRNATRLTDVTMSSGVAEPNRTDIEGASATYTEKSFGEMAPIANTDIAQATDLVELFAEYVMTVMGDIMRAREKRILDLVMTTTNFANTTALSSTNRWDVGDATSTAEPVKDILIALSAAGVSRRPNTMVIGRPAYDYLRAHTKVTAKAGTRAMDRVLGEAELAGLFGIQRILVADAKYDTAANNATASYAYLAPKSCALIYVSPSGLTFAKSYRHTPLRMVTVIDDKPGVSGVTLVKVTHEDADVIVDNTAGNCIGTVIS